MTCIVAAADGKEVVLGGDTLGSHSRGSDGIPRADAKVFRSGPYVIGFTTSYRMGQILRYLTTFPDPPEDHASDALERFFVAEFVPAIKQSFQEHGFDLKASFPSTGKEDFQIQGVQVGGLFIVGVNGHVFEIREDFQVSRPAAPYSAIGTGAPVAHGALHALATAKDISLQDRVKIALSASQTYCTVVRAPFHFVSTAGCA